jgi:hypothetical protein
LALPPGWLLSRQDFLNTTESWLADTRWPFDPRFPVGDNVWPYARVSGCLIADKEHGGDGLTKLRAGSFFASLLERRRRVDQALFAVVMEPYLHGVRTRKVDDLARALGSRQRV